VSQSATSFADHLDKPKLRGVSHQIAFVIALVAGLALVVWAPAGARIPVAIYAISLAGMFGCSALYHRVQWSDAQRPWFRRLDHSMIFVLIAGTYTPFAALVLDPPLSTIILVTVWGGAAAGILVTLFWVDAPRWVTAAIYVALGWISLLMLPALWSQLGAAPLIMMGTGGILFTVGAVVYARKSPNPVPGVFGFHEVFHAFVIAAAAIMFVAVALYAIP
jgi:hemolysin III